MTIVGGRARVRLPACPHLAAALLACLLLTIPLLSGCSRNSGGRARPVIQLSFWNGFTGPDGTTMEKIVSAFNAQNPDVRVKMQIIAWGSYYDKLTLGLAYGGAPDVLICHVNRFPEFADYGSLEPLDDLVSRPGFPSSDFAPIPWKAGMWKGKRYAVPLDCHPIGLYYNTKLFKQAGIVDAAGNPIPPANLREFIADAKKLTVDSDNDGRPEQWGMAYTWLRTNAFTFLGQFGASLLNDDLSRSALREPQAREAMQLMKSLIYDYKVCPRPEGIDAWVGFQTGRVAMAMEGIYMLSSLTDQKDLEFAGAPCPIYGDRKAVWAGTHLLAMPRAIDPKKREAAWRFIRYLSDNSIKWAEGGQVPVRKSILASPAFLSMKTQYEFSKQLPYVVYEPASVSFNQIGPFWDAAVEACVADLKPVPDALDEAARRIDAVLERD